MIDETGRKEERDTATAIETARIMNDLKKHPGWQILVDTWQKTHDTIVHKLVHEPIMSADALPAFFNLQGRLTTAHSFLQGPDIALKGAQDLLALYARQEELNDGRRGDDT